MPEKKTDRKIYLEKMTLKDSLIHVRVSKIMHSKLIIRAKRDGVSVSMFLRRIIEQQFK